MNQPRGSVLKTPPIQFLQAYERNYRILIHDCQKVPRRSYSFQTLTSSIAFVPEFQLPSTPRRLSDVQHQIILSPCNLLGRKRQVVPSPSYPDDQAYLGSLGICVKIFFTIARSGGEKVQSDFYKNSRQDSVEIYSAQIQRTTRLLIVVNLQVVPNREPLGIAKDVSKNSNLRNQSNGSQVNLGFEYKKCQEKNRIISHFGGRQLQFLQPHLLQPLHFVARDLYPNQERTWPISLEVFYHLPAR